MSSPPCISTRSSFSIQIMDQQWPAFLVSLHRQLSCDGEKSGNHSEQHHRCMESDTRRTCESWTGSLPSVFNNGHKPTEKFRVCHELPQLPALKLSESSGLVLATTALLHSQRKVCPLPVSTPFTFQMTKTWHFGSPVYSFSFYPASLPQQPMKSVVSSIS